MYQSIYYSHNGDDKGICYLRDDKKGWSEFKYYPTVYKLDPNGEYQTLFGDNCSLVQGKFDWYDPAILEKDIQKELAILRDLYYEDDSAPEKHNVIYFDIEIEIIGTLNPQTVREANAQITSVAIIDVSTGKKYCYIVDESNVIKYVDKDNKEIIPCINEKDLLSKFLTKWVELDPTIIVGYNSDFFDIPYTYFRIKKILGEDMALFLSPIKKITDNIYNSYSPITIGGVNSLDYMLLVKKYIMKEESSYKLNDIGLKYAKLGKIEYNGSLDKLFKDNPDKFIEYNLRDVEIIEALENKLQFIKLTILICHLCHVPYESIYYNTVLNEGAILTYLKRKNIISPNKPTTTNKSIKELNIGDEVQHQRGTPTVEGIITYIDEISGKVQVKTKAGTLKERSAKSIRKKDGYAGGFLLDIKPNLYSWLSDFDYSSLYPSIIRSLNLSIETLLGRVKIPDQNYNTWFSLIELKERDPEEVLILEKINKKTYELSQTKVKVKDLLEIIKENNIIISANGTFFDSSKKSIVAEILTDWFNLRKEYKKIMKEAHKREDEETYKLYERKQHAIKILLNAVYGGFAINSFRFTDGHKMCSSAITTTGQRMIQETIKYANEMIDNDYMK